MTNSDNKRRFPGFPPEPKKNYWPYPRILDGWWWDLIGSENQALTYILRHTWGFKKTADHISYSQFIRGIKKRDGTMLDRGCGIKSSDTLCRALKSLEKKGFIVSEKAQRKTTLYKLKLLWNSKEPTPEFKQVTALESKETIKGITINKYTIERIFYSYYDKINRSYPLNRACKQNIRKCLEHFTESELLGIIDQKSRDGPFLKEAAGEGPIAFFGDISMLQKYHGKIRRI